MTEGARVPKLRFQGFNAPWEEIPLFKLAKMHARIGWQNLRTSEFLDEGDYYLITGTDFVNGQIDLSSCHFVKKERYDQDSNIQVGPGSILITKDGTLGKVAYIESLDKPATLNAGVFNVTVKHSDVDSRYLFHFLKAPFLMEYVDKRATGGTIKHLNQNILVNFPVTIPTFNEQRNIGVFLTKLDSLLILNQQKKEKLVELKQAMLQKMFPREGETVPELRFPGFTEPWKEQSLEQLFDRAGSGGTPNSSVSKYYNGEIPFLSISDIKGRYVYSTSNSITEVGLQNSAAWIVPKGSIALAMYASVGKVAITAVNLATSQAFFNMVFSDTVLRDFVYTRLIKADIDKEWESLISTGTQSNLNAEKLKKFAFLLPRDKEEQESIGQFFTALDDRIAKMSRRVDKLKQLKQALLEKMFV